MTYNKSDPYLKEINEKLKSIRDTDKLSSIEALSRANEIVKIINKNIETGTENSAELYEKAYDAYITAAKKVPEKERDMVEFPSNYWLLRLKEEKFNPRKIYVPSKQEFIISEMKSIPKLKEWKTFRKKPYAIAKNRGTMKIRREDLLAKLMAERHGLVITGRTGSELVRTGRTGSELVRTGRTGSELVRTGRTGSKLVRTGISSHAKTDRQNAKHDLYLRKMIQI